ncbi:MAG: hypothetical protein ACAI43_12495, partial [Phycisphaerae bacterium]
MRFRNFRFALALVVLGWLGETCPAATHTEGDGRHTVAWDAGGNPPAKCELVLTTRPGAALIERLSISGTDVLRGADIEFAVTVGSRKPALHTEPFRYVFFDKPAGREHKRHVASLAREPARVEIPGGGRQLAVRVGKMTAGPFGGDLILRVYDGCPLVHVTAELTPVGENLAYIYDAQVVGGGVERVAWEELGIKDEKPRLVRADKMPAAGTPVAVRWRTIVGERGGGSVAVFPPPHAFFFPRDRTDNFKFAQYGDDRFGLRQDPAGGGAFVPWIDAPNGKAQRMGLFLLPSPTDAARAIERVKRYTRGDRFADVPGYRTFTSHYHSRLAVGEMAGKSPTAELARVFKAMNVNIVHLAEFHGDGHWNHPGDVRLNEMKAMFDLCKAHSDSDLLLVPGEEGIRYMAHPWPPEPKIHPGHWMYLFPKPVYLTWVRGEGQPLSEDLPGYGKVWHVGSRDDMLAVLRAERGMGWTTHPRIKASFKTPDAFKDQPWFGELWLGGAWKAMPADLSDDRLGRRCLDLLDDMLNWSVTGGYPLRRLPGEVDVFEIDRTHELYGHM